MDPFFLPAIIEQAIPAVVVLIVFGSPLTLVYVLRSFRLREKELDLRRALAERPRDEEIVALEERVSRLERDRAFFERLADHAMRSGVSGGSIAGRPRVAEVVEVPAHRLDASPEFEAVALRAPARGARAL